MTLKQDLQNQIAVLQTQLAAVNRIPDDTFTLGTVAVFSAATGQKWYYRKTGEETWKDMQGNTTNDLAHWVYNALNSNIGYFEVYTMQPGPTPIYASA